MDTFISVLREIFQPQFFVASLVVVAITGCAAILWVRSTSNARQAWEERQEQTDSHGSAAVTLFERETGQPTAFTLRIPGSPVCYHFSEQWHQPDTYIIERSHPFDEPCATTAHAA
ncbi:MAG: hypothetical protein HY340_03355 [Candidatus Kerfeldbacteria bacterium]|nr:hypothetical protein [Candidatus Kerfeldbacteria bacterium]